MAGTCCVFTVGRISRSCQLLTSAEDIKGRIVILYENGTYCQLYQRVSAALKLLDHAGALAVLMSFPLPYDNPRDPSWRHITVPAVPIYVNNTQHTFLVDLYNNLQSEGKSFNITVLPVDQMSIDFAQGYMRSENAHIIGIPVLYGLLFIVTVIIGALRIYKERSEQVGRVARLLRLCLFFVLASCLTQIIVLAIDDKAKAAIFNDRILAVLAAFSYSFNFSAVLLIISSWILIVAFKPTVFTVSRLFRSSLISLIVVNILIIIAETAEINSMSFIVLTVLIVIVVAAFAVSGTVFLRQLYISTQNAIGQRTEISRKLQALQIRMTVVLVGIVVITLALLITFIVDNASNYHPLAHLFFPFLYNIFRFLILCLVVLALYVSPKRASNSSMGSSATLSK